jgi:hypothetical protein
MIRRSRIQFHAVSDGLLSTLFSCQQADLLTDLNHNFVYELNHVKYLLVGP